MLDRISYLIKADLFDSVYPSCALSIFCCAFDSTNASGLGLGCTEYRHVSMPESNSRGATAEMLHVWPPGASSQKGY